MEAVPPRARAYVACVVLAAAVCLLPLPATHTPWWEVVLLAAVYAGCERLALRRFAGPFYPVLLAAAFLLPPPAAALVPLPDALLAPAGRRPEALRRVWRAAQPALAVWAAARVHGGLGGRDAVVTSDFPFALVPATAAVTAFCLVLTALDGGILALAERIEARRAWQGLFARSLAPIAVHGLAGLMMAVLWRSRYGPVAALLVLLPMCVSWWAYAQYHRERAAHRATIRALVQAVDIKDGYTRGHSERVGHASRLIARELGMDDERVEVLRFAGILHDVGKLGVPTRLLRKDGPLTPDERRVIELHPEYGHEMVRGISFLGEARSAILHHHERLDGSGYPYGLRGGQIPECARVVAVADAFDAMTSTRSYRRARPVGDALAELERCAGTHFDPRVVTALARALAEHGWHPTVTAEEPPTGPPPPAAPADAYGTGPAVRATGTGPPAGRPEPPAGHGAHGDRSRSSPGGGPGTPPGGGTPAAPSAPHAADAASAARAEPSGAARAEPSGAARAEPSGSGGPASPGARPYDAAVASSGRPGAGRRDVRR